MYLVNELVGMMSRHPVFLVGLGVIAILSPGVKIILWGVENIKEF